MIYEIILHRWHTNYNIVPKLYLQHCKMIVWTRLDENMEKLPMASFFKAENICFFPNLKNFTPFSIGICILNTYEKWCVHQYAHHVCVCVLSSKRKKKLIQNHLRWLPCFWQPAQINWWKWTDEQLLQMILRFSGKHNVISVNIWPRASEKGAVALCQQTAISLGTKIKNIDPT